MQSAPFCSAQNWRLEDKRLSLTEDDCIVLQPCRSNCQYEKVVYILTLAILTPPWSEIWLYLVTSQSLYYPEAMEDAAMTPRDNERGSSRSVLSNAIPFDATRLLPQPQFLPSSPPWPSLQSGLDHSSVHIKDAATRLAALRPPTW